MLRNQERERERERVMDYVFWIIAEGDLLT